MRNRICTVIPCRRGSDAKITLESLSKQTYKGFDIHVVQDEDLRGQAWALNQGLLWAREQNYEFVLFSDDDIDWQPDAISALLFSLTTDLEVAYSYGAYEMCCKIQCNVPFDADLLKRVNYISTMSLVRTSAAVDFDETLARLIDWDYWLTMLANGKTGVYCGHLIFSTALRQGITESDKANNRIRKEAVARKHGLPLEQVL